MEDTACTPATISAEERDYYRNEDAKRHNFHVRESALKQAIQFQSNGGIPSGTDNVVDCARQFHKFLTATE